MQEHGLASQLRIGVSLCQLREAGAGILSGWQEGGTGVFWGRGGWARPERGRAWPWHLRSNPDPPPSQPGTLALHLTAWMCASDLTGTDLSSPITAWYTTQSKGKNIPYCTLSCTTTTSSPVLDIVQANWPACSLRLGLGCEVSPIELSETFIRRRQKAPIQSPVTWKS